MTTDLELLIVDDEQALLDVVGLGLTSLGARVHLANSGRRGVEAYRAHHTTIDAVLLDIRMPDMDGPTTLRSLQAINPDVRVVLMTGFADRYTADELVGLGAVSLLPKPFGLTELILLLGRIRDGL
jgi:DNA-binding NtrC family response regulator